MGGAANEGTASFRRVSQIRCTRGQKWAIVARAILIIAYRVLKHNQPYGNWVSTTSMK